MKITIETLGTKTKPDACLVIGILEKGELTPSAKTIDRESRGALTKLLKQIDFQAKAGQFLPLFNFNHPRFKTLCLIGCGKSPVTPITFKKITCTAVKALQNMQVKTAYMALTDLVIGKFDSAWKVKQMVEAVWDALYRFDMFKKEKERAIVLQTIGLFINNKSDLKACQTALMQAQAIANGVILTKNLANLPSNICTPTFLMDQAKDLGKAYKKLKVKVLDEDQMHKLGMGALLAVSQGSAEEAKLIILEYQGKNKEAPIALVGKGITFDTGGNSLKTPDSMIGMKYDMSGGAAVLGVMLAIAELNLPINVVGLVAAVENMPGGSAYKPEDILTSLSGQTIEVISTDAEGRLVLADALTYCLRYKPQSIIDIATLTGAVVIALGVHATGLVSNNESLAQALLAAGVESNDRAWQLPLWDDYQQQICSPFADISNTGGRSGGAITAGCFLSRFVEKTPWAHLDIAGSAGMGMSANERGATGRPVPLLVQYLIQKSQSKPGKTAT